ncbi:MAG: DUF1700 domain-containing protein, partial [Coriobacteriaceae bacterium]|nr:DUF1700 domain-containing protein [Coriobacteriaceae bacterium]
MMDRMAYLFSLEKELKDLAIDERQNALAYYGEYLADAQAAGQNDAVAVLGSPHTLAAQIKADIAMGDGALYNVNRPTSNASDNAGSDPSQSPLQSEAPPLAK